jgi:ATP-dependent helicase/nuclease subunit B
MAKLYYTPYTDDVEEYVVSELKKRIETGSTHRVLYLTPTMFLYRRRRRRLYMLLNKEAQKSGLPFSPGMFDQLLHLNEFHHWTRELVYEGIKASPLSKTESRVIVKRAIELLLPGRKDWLSTTTDLLELFEELDASGLTFDELSKVSPYEDWKQIISIYTKYKELVQENGNPTFASCLFHAISEEPILHQYSELVLDGPFLFFRPIHEALIKRFERDGKNITYFVPFQNLSGNVNPSLEVIRMTYSNYVPYEQWIPIGKKFAAMSTDLEQLRNSLFTEHTIDNFGSLSIHSHSTVEREIQHAIRQARQLIESGQATRQGIIFVTPNAMQLRPLVREIAELEQLPVEVPPRPLLGLTSGEFIRLIYQSKWDERRFDNHSYMDASMFKRILDSRWFAGAERTIRDFQAVEDIFFRFSSSLDEWLAQVQTLKLLKEQLVQEELEHHPLNAVNQDSLHIWETILQELLHLQRVLCVNSPAPICDQVQNLMRELEDLARRTGFAGTEFGQEMLERLHNVTDRMKTQHRITLTSEEFGTAIGQLFIEEEAEEEKRKERDPDHKEILVTGLENIAYLEYKYVFLLQFTQDRYPLLPQTKWPLHHDIEWRLIAKTTRLKIRSLTEWEQLVAEREKYYFYLSFFVPRVKMNISFPRTEAGEPAYPSHYLYDVARAYRLGGEISGSDSVIKQLETYGIATIHKDNAVEAVVTDDFRSGNYELPKFDTITIDEIGLYKLCPKRFYYAQKYPEHNVYTNRFQLSRYIASLLAQRTTMWLFLTLNGESLTEDLQSGSWKASIVNHTLPELLRREAEKLKPFFPVDREVWENGRYYAEIMIKNIMDMVFDEKYAREALQNGTAQLKVTFEANPRTEIREVSTDQGAYKVFGVRELSAKFGGATRTFSISHYPHLLGIGSYELCDEQGNRSSFASWYYQFKRDFFAAAGSNSVQSTLQDAIASIEQGHFDKKEGEHCSYCPFHMQCQK